MSMSRRSEVISVVTFHFEKKTCLAGLTYPTLELSGVKSGGETDVFVIWMAHLDCYETGSLIFWICHVGLPELGGVADLPRVLEILG